MWFWLGAVGIATSGAGLDTKATAVSVEIEASAKSDILRTLERWGFDETRFPVRGEPLWAQRGLSTA